MKHILAVLASIFLFTASAHAQTDAISLAGATIERSAGDVASWPITTYITSLNLGADNCAVEFDKQDEWPNVPIPGWDGGSIQYTLWMVRIVNGQVYAGGGIEFWKGRVGGCGPAAKYVENWYYDSSWGPLHDAGDLTPGERVGFFVTAGDARAKDVRSVTGRSAVVAVPWPGGSGGSFTFQPTAPPVITPVIVPPAPIVAPTAPVVAPITPVVAPITPAPLPATELSAMNTQLAAMREQLAQVSADVKAFREEVESKWTQFVGPLLKYGAAIAAGMLAKWKL
jgi:hypothetical protein